MTQRPTQPVREYTGLDYGENKRLNDAQKALPLPNNTPQTPTAAAVPQRQPVQRPNVFGPTQRPNEPLTAGAGLLPDDPIAHLRALYLKFPNEDLRRLIERASTR